MEATTKHTREIFGIEGRCSITIECADDLTSDERFVIKVFFESMMGLIQKEDSRSVEQIEALRARIKQALGCENPAKAVSDA